jgi:hypothetical protein
MTLMILPLAAMLFGQLGAPSSPAAVTAPAPATAAAPAATTAAPMLGAISATASNSALRSAGFKEVVIGTNWSSIEPSKGAFSASALAGLQSQINASVAAGLSPSLDIGVQYAPSWIFTVGGGTQFKDQFGDVFSGSPSSGNDVPNAVTDTNVRTQLGTYISYLGSHLTGLGSVRLGGAAYNELRYPSGQSGSQANAFWFYDTSSQALLASSARGWKPGTGTTAQASTFIIAYDTQLADYGVWLAKKAEAAFPAATKAELLMPGWGDRPGEITSAIAARLGNTPDEVNQGLHWAQMMKMLPADNRVVAYSTYADATQGGSGNPDPAAYIHTILRAGVLQGGESTGNGQTTTTGEHLMFTDAKSEGWYVANWFTNNQSQSLSQVAQSFGSA